MADWQNGLFGCFNDCGICLCSYFLPCYQFGKNAEALGESCFLCGVASLFGLPLLIFGALHRQKLRELKGIDGSIIGDAAAFFCCPVCAIAQMGQEVQSGVPGAQAMARE
jgi:Cys-rich protein (TIGR01571 family)